MSEKLKNLRRNKRGEIVYGYLTEEQRNDVEIMTEIVRQEEEKLYSFNLEEIIEISGPDVKKNPELNAKFIKILEDRIEDLKDREYDYGITRKPLVDDLIQKCELQIEKLRNCC